MDGSDFSFKPIDVAQPIFIPVSSFPVRNATGHVAMVCSCPLILPKSDRFTCAIPLVEQSIVNLCLVATILATIVANLECSDGAIQRDVEVRRIRTN